MARRWTLGLLGGAAAAAGAVSCAVVAGLGDYQAGNPAIDASFADVADGADGASGAEGSTPNDAGFDVPELPSCGAGNVCFAGVAGWEGPFQVSESPFEGGAGPPSCPDAAPYRDQGLLTDIVVPDASCACTCTTSVTCSATISVFNDNGSCASQDLCGFAHVTESSTNPCVSLTCSQAILSGTATPDPAGCTASPLQLPDASFGTSAYSCGAVTVDSGVCDAGALCTEAPGPGFRSRLCIRKKGENGCPAGSSYPYPYVYYTALDDGRTCQGCGCDVVGEPACNYNLQFYGAAGCSTSAEKLGNLPTGPCASLNPAPGGAARSVSVGFPLANPDAGCTAGDASVSGAVVGAAAGAVTFCCTQ